MDFESIRKEILLGRGQGNLNLKPKQKEALQAIVFERSKLFNRLVSNCAATKEQSRGSGGLHFPLFLTIQYANYSPEPRHCSFVAA